MTDISENKKEQLKKLLRPKGGVFSLSDVMFGNMDFVPEIDLHYYHNGFISDFDENLLCVWDIEQDDINCQSEETIDFVFELIIKRLKMGQIKDPEQIRKYEECLKKCAEIEKIINNGICPECGSQTEKVSDYRQCFNCGWFY